MSWLICLIWLLDHPIWQDLRYPVCKFKNLAPEIMSLSVGVLLSSIYKVLPKEGKETIELCRTMQQRGVCPLLVVFNTCVLNSLHSLLFTYWNLFVFNLEFVVLLPNFAICVHATGTCVCNTALNFLVSQTHYTHKLWPTHTFSFTFLIYKNDTWGGLDRVPPNPFKDPS
jgi:hypothetical protein